MQRLFLLMREDILFTTDAVILEFLAMFSTVGPYLRQQAATRVDEMLSNPGVRVVEVTRARLLRLALYKDRLDKLTDCVSMQTMRRESLTDVLINALHFTREGFHIVFV